MRISKGFIKSSLIYTLAGMLPTASAVLLLPFYQDTRYLSVELYGAFSLYLTVSLLVQILTAYSFDSSLYVHYHEFKNDKAKLGAFVSSAFMLMLTIGGGVGLILFLAGDLAFAYFFKEINITFFPYGALAVATGIFQALFKVYNNFLQSREKASLFLGANLTSFLLIATLTIVGLRYFPHTLWGPVGGRMVALFLCAFWVMIRVLSEFGIHFNLTLLKSSFQFNLFTFIYQIEQWIINYFDRFIMLIYVTLADVGVYDFTLKCLVIIELLMNGLYSAFLPKVLSTLVEQKDNSTSSIINRYYHGYTAFTMILVCGVLIFFPVMFDWFNIQPEYRDALRYAPGLAALYIFKALRVYFALPYTALKYSKPLPGMYAVIIGVKFALMWALLDRYQVQGVIIASTASAVVDIVLLEWVIRSKFSFQFNKFKLLIMPLLLWLVIIIGELTLANDYPFFARVGYMVVCLILLYWAYRKEIKVLDFRKLIR